MFWGQTITGLFSKTGLVGWLLLLCSIIGIAIILDRTFYFIRLRFDYSTFSRKLFIHLRENSVMKAIHLCQSYQNPVAKVAGIYLSNLNNKRRDSILSREGSFAIEKVETRLRGLATITHIAPLLGLLGTVAGLVSAFHEIELLGGGVQAENLAGGIWEALLSTVFGLLVALPCMVAYHSFESKADKIARRMQSIVSELDQFYGNRGGTQFKSSDPDDDNELQNLAQ